MKKRLFSYLVAVAMILSVLLSSVGCDLSAFDQILAIPDDGMTPTATDKADTDSDETTYIDDEETDEETEKETKKEEETTKKRPSFFDTETAIPPETELETFHPDYTDEINTGYPKETDYPVPPEIETSDEWYPEDTVEPECPLDHLPPHYGELYGGESFLIAAVKERTNIFYVHGIENEYNVLADIANDRNQFISSEYHIEIANKYVDSVQDLNDLVNNSFASGDQSVQAFISHAGAGISQYVMRDQLLDLRNLNINLDASYWDYSMMENLSVDGKLIAGFGDMLATDADIILFNKNMMSNYMIENLYDVVYDGRWTLEELNSAILKAGYCDLNGDGMTDEDDAYGLVFDSNLYLDSFIFSSGISPVGIDYASGERFIDINDNFFRVYDYLENMVKNYRDIYRTEVHSVTNMFTRGNALFTLTNTSNISKYIYSESPFGILPYPKADFEQAEYQSLYRGGYICVLGNIENPDLVGTSLDLLNYFGEGLESQLWLKTLSSDDDIRMMDLIRGGLVSDFARVVARDRLTSLVTIYSKTMTGGSHIHAECDRYSESWETVIKEYLV